MAMNDNVPHPLNQNCVVGAIVFEITSLPTSQHLEWILRLVSSVGCCAMMELHPFALFVQHPFFAL